MCTRFFSILYIVAFPSTITTYELAKFPSSSSLSHIQVVSYEKHGVKAQNLLDFTEIIESNFNEHIGKESSSTSKFFCFWKALECFAIWCFKHFDIDKALLVILCRKTNYFCSNLHIFFLWNSTDLGRLIWNSHYVKQW